MKKICSIVGCNLPVHCWGLCNKHRLQVSAGRKRTKPCACGCGALVSARYAAGHHTRLFPAEEQSRRARFNDGSTQRDRGSADWYRKVRGRHEHRRVMEQMLGRSLLSSEVVHHINENKKDNRPENLRLMTRAEHFRHHLDEARARSK